MKSTLRFLSGALCALLLLLAVTACDTADSWRDDLTSAALNDTVKAALPSEDGWEPVSDDYVSPSAWGESYADYLALVTDHCITLSAESDMNVDEWGIFRLKDTKDAASFKTFVEDYLEAKKLRMTPLLESYNQPELPKLDCAKVTVCGIYVFYTILDAEDTATAHNAFETAVKRPEAE